MKAVLKTLPKELEMKYGQKFGSEENTDILREVVPRLVNSLKRYKVSYDQVRKWLQAVLVRDNVQGKFQCPGHVLDIVPDMSRPSVLSKYPIILRGFKLIYLGQY